MRLIEPQQWNGTTLHDVHPLHLDDAQYEQWLVLNMKDEPRRSIGGTNMAGIVGASPWITPAGVYDSILRLVPDKVFGDTPRSQRGIVLEPIIIDLYAKRTGRIVTDLRETQHHAQYPFLTAHPDGFMHDTTGRGLLEVKTVDTDMMANVKDHGVPANYAIQLAHYMNVCDAQWGEFVFFDANNWQMHIVPFPYDRTFQQELLARGVAFWNDHVRARVRPEELNSTATISAPVVGAEAVTMDTPEYRQAVEAWVRASAERKLAEHGEELARRRVAEMVERDGIDKLVVDGHKVARMQLPGKERLDEAALYRDHPYIDLDAYRSVGEPSKPFVRLWPAKGNRR
jgi:predicted phage-related endonuclease